MPKYDGASAKTNGYVNKAINFLGGAAGGGIGHAMREKAEDVSKYVKEVFPAENPMMGSKKEAEIKKIIKESGI